MVHMAAGFSALAAALLVGKRMNGATVTESANNIPFVLLGAVLLSVMVYPLHPLGAGPEFRDAAGFNAKGGVWEAEPHRALAGGVLYFTLMGLARPFLAWAHAVRTAAETGAVRGQERNVHPMTDRRMWIGPGLFVFVLVIGVLLVYCPTNNLCYILASVMLIHVQNEPGCESRRSGSGTT